MAMTIGERIHARRKQLGFTMEEVGNAVGVAKGTVLRWENGFIENMRIDKIENLAAKLEVPLSWLLGSGEDYIAYANIEFMPDTQKVPVIGTIACGQPLLAEENIEGFTEVDGRVQVDFALRCSGDSMINARIFDGDLIYIRKQDDVDNGEIAAVIINDEATLKRVYKYDNRIELRPENPTFPVLNYEGKECEDIRIIGKAVAFLSTVR